MVEIWTGGTETETVPKDIGVGEEKDMTDTVVSEDKIVERLAEGLGATVVKETEMERKRKALIEFCGEHMCTDCPLGTDGHKCGAGYSFRCGICEPGYIADAEVEEAYKLAFPEREDAQMHEGIATGNAAGEEKPGGEKYRNYCECCAHTDTEKCDGCERAYDGIPTGYLFELARKSQEDIRGDILEQAKICVCTDRKEQYGEAEQSFRCIADMWNAYLRPVYPDICITPVQASMMMVLFKAARDAVAKVHKVDTYVDMCGYAACAGGMLE